MRRTAWTPLSAAVLYREDSTAFAIENSEATATNDSSALAVDNCTATAQNGEVVECPQP